MNIFKKQVKFVSAICPKCNGSLELDADLETAFCQYCGTQCIVENAPKKKTKQSNLETIVGFLERRQNLRRQDRREKQRKLEEEERQQKEHLKKYWWIYVLCFVAYMTIMIILASGGK